MPKAPYLQKRRRLWYAVLEIPRSLRPAFGKAHFVRSLETDSPTLAQRRVGPLISGWLADLDRARQGRGGDDERRCCIFPKGAAAGHHGRSA